MENSKKTLTQEQLKRRSVKQLIALAKNENYNELTQIAAIVTAANRKTFDKKANADLIGKYEEYKARMADEAKKSQNKTSKKSQNKTSKKGFNGKPRGRFNHPDIKNESDCIVVFRDGNKSGKLLYCNRNSTEYCVVEVEGVKYEKSLSKVLKA